MKIIFRNILPLLLLLLAGYQVYAGKLPEYNEEEIFDEFSELVTIEDNCTDIRVHFSFFEPSDPFDAYITTQLKEPSEFKKKKGKRPPSSYGIRVVNRQLPLIQPTNLSYGYKKPYFLHQLHAYLFRLTPF